MPIRHPRSLDWKVELMGSSEDTVILSVGRTEALVLFDMLAEFYGQSSLEVHDSSERLALVRLHGALEKTLVEPFRPDYGSVIAEARSSLAAQSGDT
jgi:hypothetical protein